MTLGSGIHGQGWGQYGLIVRCLKSYKIFSPPTYVQEKPNAVMMSMRQSNKVVKIIAPGQKVQANIMNMAIYSLNTFRKEKKKKKKNLLYFHFSGR